MSNVPAGSIGVQCACGKQSVLSCDKWETLAGKLIKCPQCGNGVLVPPFVNQSHTRASATTQTTGVLPALSEAEDTSDRQATMRPQLRRTQVLQRSWLGIVTGWVTIAGLGIVVLAIQTREVAEDPLPIILLCLGSGCTLVAGVTWAHTQRQRRLKTVFLGIAGAISGAIVCGYLGGEVLAADGNVSAEIGAILIGSWLGAILFGWLGVWWGMRISRRLAA
jgi:uncharacterized membrane protein YsdA (DUF1294 family)